MRWGCTQCGHEVETEGDDGPKQVKHENGHVCNYWQQVKYPCSRCGILYASTVEARKCLANDDMETLERRIGA